MVPMPLRQPLVIDPRAWSTLRREAQGRAGRECCGALLADVRGHIVAAVPVRNEAARPDHSYRIGADAVRALDARAREGGLAVVGCYHSHPSGSLRPSARDRDEALPNFLYIIVSGRTADRLAAEPFAAAWRLRDDRSGFQPVPLPAEAT
jgi:desampylase